MTDLDELLQRTAAEVPIGPPPLEQIHARARRARRRRNALTTLGAAAAVVGIIGLGSTVVPHLGQVGQSDSNTAMEADAGGAEAPTAGSGADTDDSSSRDGWGEPTKTVSLRSIAIDVPQSWRLNAGALCRESPLDSYWIDPEAVAFCGHGWQPDRTWVRLFTRTPADDPRQALVSFDLPGDPPPSITVSAQRSPQIVTKQTEVADGSTIPLYSALVRVVLTEDGSSKAVDIEIESTVGPEAVERLLASVRYADYVEIPARP